MIPQWVVWHQISLPLADAPSASALNELIVPRSSRLAERKRERAGWSVLPHPSSTDHLSNLLNPRDAPLGANQEILGEFSAK